jgi:uncharacterized protein (TIRG00374 family)
VLKHHPSIPLTVVQSRILKILVSLALTVGLVWLLLRQVHPGEVAHRIAGASPAWLCASAALAIGTYILRSWRWVWILRPAGRVGFGQAFYATAVGFAGNFLPARAGEIIRPALLSRDTGLPFSTLLASILFERLLDAASVFFFLGLAILDPPWTRGPGSSAVPVAIGALPLIGLAGIVTFSWIAIFHRGLLENLTSRLARLLPERWRGPVLKVSSAFLDGFGLVRKLTAWQWLLVGGGSLLMWLAVNLQIACVVKAFGIDLPLSASYVLTFAAVIGLAVPTPGGIGSYHAAVAGALGRFHVQRDIALGVATVSHAVSFIPISLIGLGWMLARALRRTVPEPEPR